MKQQRIYPVGIQDFEKLRQKGAIYVDKTDLMYQLVQKDYVFLSRPRRFGKSLLSNTLKYYFQGRKELFQGLAIDMEKCEYYYETIFYLIFSFMNRHIQTQVKTCRRRADMVMYTAKAIYVFELKMNKPAQEALDQIDEKGYMVPFTADGRKLVKCGISFSTKTRTIEEWMIKEQ